MRASSRHMRSSSPLQALSVLQRRATINASLYRQKQRFPPASSAARNTSSLPAAACPAWPRCNAWIRLGQDIFPRVYRKHPSMVCTETRSASAGPAARLHYLRLPGRRNARRLGRGLSAQASGWMYPPGPAHAFFLSVIVNSPCPPPRPSRRSRARTKSARNPVVGQEILLLNCLLRSVLPQ